MSRRNTRASFQSCRKNSQTVFRQQTVISNKFLSHACMHATNAISHAINAISDECDKSDTYHTCNITSLKPRPHLLLAGMQNRRPERRRQGRAAPLQGDDDAALDCDSDVNDVARPVSVTTINSPPPLVAPSNICTRSRQRDNIAAPAIVAAAR
jgi:hypothetical protein